MRLRAIQLTGLTLLTMTTQGCVAANVASKTISTGATVVKTTAKVGKGAVDIAIPDDDSDENNDESAPKQDRND